MYMLVHFVPDGGDHGDTAKHDGPALTGAEPISTWSRPRQAQLSFAIPSEAHQFRFPPHLIGQLEVMSKAL